MEMKKWHKIEQKMAAVLMAALLAGTMLTGCGSSGTSATAAQTTEAAESQTEQEQTEEEKQTAEAAAQTSEAADETETGNQSGEEEAKPTEVRIAALKGPTAMGMVKFMDDVDQNAVTDESYSFQIVASPDEVTPQIAKGEVDIAAVPGNLASVLFNNMGGDVQVLTINTLGVLYIVENGDTVHSAADLKGKTIYASGKGSTPEYALNYILEQNGLTPGTDVTIEWKSEHSECVAAIAADPSGIAMLPQPFVTTAQTKNTSLRVALDLTQEWERVQEDKGGQSTLITGVTIVRTAFAQEHPEAVSHFLKHYQESVDYVNANTNEAAVLVGNYDIVTAEVAQKALPECNIVYIAGEEMKEKLSGYLAVLYEENPEAVGGALPDNEFYYTQQEE